MRRVVRVRSEQPDFSPGVFVAAIILIILISQDWLVWWSLILVLLVPPVVNYLLVGKTTKDEITIEKDV